MVYIGGQFIAIWWCQLNCPYCLAQTPIIWWGYRKNKGRGRVQRWLCQRCKRTFIERDAFYRKHKAPETILSVLIQWFKGLTSRELAEEHSVCQRSVLRWLKEYIGKLYAYLRERVPRFTKKLHLDELFLKMRGTFYYLWDGLCKETRFFVFFFSKNRDYYSCTKLLEQCPQAGIVVTDGAFSYARAVRERYGSQAKHVQCIEFEDKKNNNIMERMQNTARRWLHPRRGFHSLETGTLQLLGFWVFYNFIRTHMSLGKTPAEKAGVIEPWRNLKNQKERLKALLNRAYLLWHIFHQPKMSALPLLYPS